MVELSVADKIATICMTCPPVNAITRGWANEFSAHLDKLASRSDWRILCISSGLRLFSAGGDIKQFAARLDQADAGSILAEEAKLYQSLFDRIVSLKQISIAFIGGVAAGGGFELAMACDLRVAARSAKVGLPEVGIGLLPSAGGTQRMTRLIGAGRALKLIGTAELIHAPEALDLGLVEWVVPDEGFAETALQIALGLAGKPSEALCAAKSCIRAALDPKRDGFAEEAQAPRTLMSSEETRARIAEFMARSSKTKA
jgi:enoyl-CoA hydratase